MRKVDMSARAVTARLRRVSELRRLCLSLRKAKLRSTDEKRDKTMPDHPLPIKVAKDINEG
jgi:hypothetical protein